MPCGVAGSFISATSTTTTKERKEYMNNEIVIPVQELKPGLSDSGGIIMEQVAGTGL
jgi:hypothetical protein